MPPSASSARAKLGRRKRAAGANKGVGIDFKKVKHKIGKRLPRAANDTNTEVRAKAIALPGQRSLTADKAGAAVSARGLTLGELLAQWPHPSDKVRKGALQQAGELLQAHPELVARHAGPLVARVCERLSDGSPAVRQALLSSVLKPPSSPLLPELRRCGALAAFAPLLAAHLSAALTHLDAGVRADALAALEAVADASPSVLATPAPRLAGWLGHYSALLSRAHRGRTVRAQALAPLARVLGSAARVTKRLAQGQEQQQDQAAAAGGQQQAPPSALPLGARRAAFGPASGAGGGLTPAALMRIYCGGGNASDQEQQPEAATTTATTTTDEVQAAALGLLEAAFGCWAECAPGALSTAPEAEAAGALRDVLAAGNQLVPLALGPEPLREAGTHGDGAAAAAPTSPLLPSTAAAARFARAARCARAVLPRLLPHFPAREPALPPTQDVADAVARYNLEAAQLLAALVAALSAGGVEEGGGGNDGATSSSKSAASLASLHAKARAALVDYLCSALSTGRAVPGGEAGNGGGNAAPAQAPGGGGSNATALACLRAARVALPALPAGGNERRELLAAVCAAGSPAAAAGGKRAREEGGGSGGGGGGGAGVLAARLALQRDLLEAHLLLSRGRRRPPQDDEEDDEDDDPDAEAEEEMAAWLTGAPRLLWEAAARCRRQSASAGGNPAAAEAALAAIALPLLSMLHTAARLCAPQSPLEDALRTVQQMLAPLLAVASSSAAAAAAVVPGPLSALPPASQELGLSLVAHLPGPLDAALLKAVAMALRCPSAPQQQQQQQQAPSGNKRRRLSGEGDDAEAAKPASSRPQLAYSDAAASRLLEAVLLAAAPPRTALPPEAYLSFVATLLAAGASPSSPAPSPSSSPSLSPSSPALFARHRLVAACVAQRLHWYGPPARLAELAASPLLTRWEEARAPGGKGTEEADPFAVRALAFSLLSLSAAAAGPWTPALGGDAAGEAAWAARAEARALRPLEEGQEDSGKAAGLGLPPALAARLPSVVEDWVWGSVAAAAAASAAAGEGAASLASAAETAVAEALPLLAQRCLLARSGGGDQQAEEDPALQVVNSLLRAGLGDEEEEGKHGAAAEAAALARLGSGGMAVAALRAALAVVDCPRIHEAWRAGGSATASSEAGGRALAAAQRLRAAVAEAGGRGLAAHDADNTRAARRLETRLAECFGGSGDE